jgi:RNA recognition motif-containing protein
MTESGTNETPEKTKLFVGGLQSANGGCLATEEQLTTYFKKWGNVVNFQLIKVKF